VLEPAVALGNLAIAGTLRARSQDPLGLLEKNAGTCSSAHLRCSTVTEDDVMK
jgi:hypothetical protein